MSNGIVAGSSEDSSQNLAQQYLSTRGDDSGLSFEDVLLKAFAPDDGLYIPEEIPSSTQWQRWQDLPFAELAFEILSLYISPTEIPANDLRDVLRRSYSTFRAPEVTPLVPLDGNLYLLELFHGPSYAFEDVADQLLGNLFEYFLAKRNQGKEGRDRRHLTVVEASTVSSPIHGLKGKQDVSVLLLHPSQVSRFQELQMATVLDMNVLNVSVSGSLDDCQSIVRSLVRDPDLDSTTLQLNTVSSTNWARILAQIVYYFHSYFSLAKSSSSLKIGDKVRFSVPTGSFGNALAGYFAYRMGLPIDKLVIATNENDILDRFWKTGRYDKKTSPAGHEPESDNMTSRNDAASGGVKTDLDVAVPINLERLLWFLAYEFASSAGMDDEWNKKQAGQEVDAWYRDLERKGAFGPVYKDVLESARRRFETEQVSEQQILDTIRSVYGSSGYVLEPRTAVGVEAARRSMARTGGAVPHIAMATAHPASFSGAVKLALERVEGFDLEKVTPAELASMEGKEKRVCNLVNHRERARELVKSFVQDQHLNS